jgi:hypothetical protein
MDIALTLTKRYEGSEWTLDGDSYSGLTWLSDDIEQPTLEELQLHWEDVQHEVATEAIRNQRLAAYREESDPIFFDYQRGEATEDEWLDAIQDIKDRYPYPVIEDES